MESIVERPDTYEVPRPAEPHTLVEPFGHLRQQHEEQPQDRQPSCVIFLNTDLLKIDLARLWDGLDLRICADGGANQLYSCFNEEERAKHVPDYIVGDFDSLRPEVRQYYADLGTVILPQYSQYSTDFMKAVKVAVLANSDRKELLTQKMDENDGLGELVKSAKSVPFSIYVVGGIGGRFDQTFQAINQLYCMQDEYPQTTVFFVSDSDIIFLASGKTYVSYPSRLWLNKDDPNPKCGILPFGGPVVLHSLGLKYDVAHWPSHVGGNVSTSNALVGDTGFVVDASGPVVVSIEITHHR